MLIVTPALLALALIIVLMAGAGRKYKGERGKVTFMAIDRPWLDIGLCLLAVCEFLVVAGFYEAAKTAWRYSSMSWIYVLCAALSVFAPLPLLGWLMSFTKRCKAGKWWRHTLIYRLLAGISNRLKHFGKSLWAGVSLTARVILLGSVLLAVNVMCAGLWPSGGALFFAFVPAALGTFGFLRYARKLHLIEQGAKAATGGRYDTPIAVTDRKSVV